MGKKTYLFGGGVDTGSVADITLRDYICDAEAAIVDATIT